MAETRYIFAPLPHDSTELNDALRRISTSLTSLNQRLDALALSRLTNRAATVDTPLPQTVTDDLRFPATGINLPGQSADPDRETETGLLLFDDSITEVVAISEQLPHAWAEGSPIVPHVHWQKTAAGAGDVLWRLEYKRSAIGAVMDSAWTVIDQHQTVASTPDNNLADEHLITSFGDVDMTGYQISDMIIMRLSRVPSEAEDTYANDVRLLEFDVHVQKDSLGSVLPFTKAVP